MLEYHLPFMHIYCADRSKFDSWCLVFQAELQVCVIRCFHVNIGIRYSELLLYTFMTLWGAQTFISCIELNAPSSPSILNSQGTKGNFYFPVGVLWFYLKGSHITWMLRIILFFSAELVTQVTTLFATLEIPFQWHRLSVSGFWGFGFFKETNLKDLS